MTQSKNISIAKHTAQMLLKIGGVTFRFDPPYIYTSGIKAPIYIDNRLIVSYPDIRKTIINYYIELMKKEIGLENIDYISATATAALPHGAWIADRLNIPMVYVKPTTKSYGKQTKLDGYLKKGSRVVVIEDLISTATSAVGNTQTIRELGGIVKYCVATINYDTEKSRQILKENKLKLFALATAKEVVEEATLSKYINPSQQKDVREWFADPIHWGDRFNK